MSYELTLPNEKNAWRRLQRLAERCAALSGGLRPETSRLSRLYEKKRKEYGLSKAAMDERIYLRMYKRTPDRLSRVLKIRYWRTGRHVPANRETALLFAGALELSAEDTAWLITAWLDRALVCYQETPPESDALYWERRGRLEALACGYLRRQRAALSCESSGSLPKKELSGLRHLYYMDALRYIRPDEPPALWKKHIYSARYDLEFKRSLRLLGEIPRTTMLRHLILFGLPGLTCAWLNRQLSFFGYLPLSPGHTLTGGEPLDDLLLSLLSSYERLVRENGAKNARLWFLYCCQRLDAYFAKEHKNALRFMYFKSLE